MKNYSNRGFTLIELLVVIAIIGILSSVVLASLNTARSKGADTAIKANLATLRVQSEFYYDTNSTSYGIQASSTILASDGTCGGGGMFGDQTVKGALRAAMAQTGDASRAYCAAYTTGWSASVPFKSNPNISWCVGNIGKAGTTTTPANVGSFTGC